ncbi:MAG: hypothetical protein MUF13_02810 [Akkermansiaceae bacterium]|jgi:signal transduction histidine kinase|nr:hypothetical protein [Akkermansiaceae bacterium]
MTATEIFDESEVPWPAVVARAVHDMRSPLSTMGTSLELLRMLPPDSDKRSRIMQILDEQVAEMTMLLNQLSTHPQAFLDESAHGAT